MAARAPFVCRAGEELPSRTAARTMMPCDKPMIPNERLACPHLQPLDRRSTDGQVKRDIVHHSNLTPRWRVSNPDHRERAVIFR
jgi:hypothetical protein